MASPPTIHTDARRAAFHARLRWLGAPLLATGGLLVFWALGVTLRGGPTWILLLSIAGALMGLTSFGVNHDTAMTLAQQVRQQRQTSADSAPVLSAALDRELADELAHDRDAVLEMQANPRTATIIPLFALGVQGVVFWRLLVLSGVGAG